MGAVLTVSRMSEISSKPLGRSAEPSYAKIAEEVRLDNMRRYTARLMWILSAAQAEKYSLQAARKAATIAYYHLRSRRTTCCSAVGASAGIACEGEAKL